MQPEIFLTKRDVAQILKISLPTVTRYANAGVIPSYRIGTRIRFKKAEITSSLKQIPATRKTVEP